MASMDSEGKTHTRYPLASMMTSMKHSTQGTLGLGTSEGHEACDKAFEPSAQAMEGPLCCVVVECCGSVASHFRPSLFMVFLGEFLFIFSEVFTWVLAR